MTVGVCLMVGVCPRQWGYAQWRYVRDSGGMSMTVQVYPRGWGYVCDSGGMSITVMYAPGKCKGLKLSMSCCNINTL